jgi:L-amino acid N-acyltransferase YncA
VGASIGSHNPINPEGVAEAKPLGYGPICVAESERGHGLATALFAELRERLPGRECVAFVRRDNAASLRAHLKMGMKDVASFEHDGVAHAVLAFAAPRRA